MNKKYDLLFTTKMEYNVFQLNEVLKYNYLYRSCCQKFKMYLIWLGPGVHVVALVPVAGPVPPPNMVVKPDATASRASCAHMKCT